MQKWQRQGWLSEIDLRRILCCLQNMRMLCNSTFLFDKRTHHSPKLAEFRGIIRELTLEENRKVVVFSEYERMTFLAGEELRKMGIGFVSLPGGVPSRKRGALIEEFHRQPNCRVFLSTDAGGVGLESRSSAGQQVQGALSTLFSRHPQTNHPILSIPLPESFTAERITQAVARFLSALEVPAK